MQHHTETPSRESRTLTYTVDQLVHASNLSRATLYREINEGRLEIVKVGRRTLITRKAAEQWLERLAAGGEL